MSIELEKLERQIQAAPGEKEKVDIILDFALRMGPRDIQAYGSLIERAHKISADPGTAAKSRYSRNS
ncbi:MAG: hypothetical protein GY757_28850 [bacterium]|nr:hypothetical protein [bacterium]